MKKKVILKTKTSKEDKESDMRKELKIGKEREDDTIEPWRLREIKKEAIKIDMREMTKK
jgi:hypothetical protein